MIEVDDFLKINKIENLDSPKILALNRPKGGDIRANFLRGIVYCGHCQKSLTSMLIDKKKDGKVFESRYYYKCETVGCEMEGKSAKAKYVIDAAQSFLSTYLFVTKDNYDVFMKSAKAQIKRSQYKIDSTIAKLKVDIANKEASYEKIKSLLENDDTGKLQKHYDLDETLNRIEQMREQYTKLLQARKDAPDALPTFEEYLKLFESTSVILGKIRDMKQMDSFLRIFFSNFTITATGKSFSQGSSVTYKLKEPYAGFVLDKKFSLGASTGTLTLDLFHGKEAL